MGDLDPIAARPRGSAALDAHRINTTRLDAGYTVLLAGAGLEGWRSIAIQGVCNPAMIERIDSIVGEEIRNVESQTLDMIFKDRDAYDAVARDRLITRELIAERYGLEPEDVVVVEYIDALCAVKATYKRRFAAGSPGDSDCFGMNQEAPLLDIEI